MSRRSVLSDTQWETIQPLLPAQRPWSGRPRRDHRQVVEGIIYRYRCGIAWRDLPADFGPWQTVWKRHRAWAVDGTWDQVLDALLVRADADGDLDWSVAVDSTICRAHQHGTTLERTTGAQWNHKNLRVEPADHALGRSRGGLSTKIHQLVDGHGLPLVILCGPGQGGDSPMLAPLLDALSVARKGPGRPRTRPDMLRGDKAYFSRATRQTLRRRGIKAVIPEPSDQQQHRRNRGSRGGRPVGLDMEAYRGRNVIERGYSDVKQWRGLATRYDKLGLTYRAGAVLRAIIQWLNHLV